MQALRLPACAVCLIVALSGCASSVERATPADLRAAPGSVFTLARAQGLDATYRVLSERMAACWEQGRLRVKGDKIGGQEGQISLVSAGMMTANRTFATVVIEPDGSGSRITTYAATTAGAPGLQRALSHWLAGGKTCDGSAIE